MKSKAKMVADLRKLIGDDGLGKESLKMFASIVADKNPDAISALLLLNKYSDDDDRIDEMYTVIHTVEGFPSDVYVRELVATVPELSDNSPYLLDLLIIRLLNSTEEDVRILSDRLRSSDAKGKKGAKNSLERIIAETSEKHVSVIRRAKAIVNKLG